METLSAQNIADGGAFPLESSFEEWKPEELGAGPELIAMLLNLPLRNGNTSWAAGPSWTWTTLLNLPLRNGNSIEDICPPCAPLLLNLPLRNGNTAALERVEAGDVRS